MSRSSGATGPSIGVTLEMRQPSVAPYIWAAALIAVAIWGMAGTPQMAHTSASTHIARVR